VTVVRPLLLGLVAGLALAASSGCNVTPCTPENCDGCCDDYQVCRAGNESSACGLAGSACINCGGDVCNANGTCFGTYSPLPRDAGLDDLLPDANFVDAGLVEEDAGVDAGEPDAGAVDAGVADAGEDAGLAPDSGVDAGSIVDAGTPDAGLDAGIDAGIDAGVFLPRDQCETPIRVSDLDAGFADRPVVDFANGRVLLLFHAYTTSGTTSIRTRLYEGGAWAPSTTHPFASGSIFLQEELALDPDGNAAFAWTSGPGSFGRRLYSRTTNLWADAPWMSPPPFGERNRVIWTAPGAFFHGWSTLSTPLYSTASATGFTAEAPLTSVMAQPLDLAVGRMVDGEVAVVWRDTNRTFRGRFVDAMGSLKMGGEAAFAEPSTAGSIGRPVVGAQLDGDAFLAWERRNNDGSVQLMTTVLHDDSPAPVVDAPVELARGHSAYGSPQLLVDGQGDLTLTWIDSNNATFALRRNGGTWGAPVQLGPAGSGIASNRRAVIDAEGHVTVALYVSLSPARFQLRRIARGSQTWGAPFATPTMPVANFATPALALTAAGEPMFFFREDSASSPIFLTICR
jgi:hypothetical protein